MWPILVSLLRIHSRPQNFGSKVWMLLLLLLLLIALDYVANQIEHIFLTAKCVSLFFGFVRIPVYV